MSRQESSNSDDLQVAYEELGDTYVKLGQRDKAMSAFENALKSNLEDSDKHGLRLRLAQCYLWQNATSKAKDMLNQIVTSGDPFWSKVAQAQIDEINIRESVR